MNKNLERLNRPLATVLSAVACLLASACGGGGGGEIERPSTLQTPSDAPVPTATTAESTASAVPAASAAATQDDDASQIATAMAQSVQVDPPAPTIGETLLTPGSDAKSNETPSASPAPTIQALAVQGNASATPQPKAAAGRTFYVNSATGNDTNDGLAETSSRGGAGSWRTLAKLATATLQPGDTVRLACGSTWSETLRISNSGNSTSPITLAAYPTGCTNPPVIDGGTSLQPSAWTQHSGNIYKAVLASPPQQLLSTAGTMTVAHHPNRGFDATRPDSLYLKVASDADKTTIGGRSVSTSLTTGADLKLPVGAILQPGATVRIRSKSWFIDESVIASVNCSKLTLTKPTSYALTAGWGYYLLGALWMLDSAGEWHYETASHTLYVWMPDSRAPSSAVVAGTLATGIDLGSRQYVTVDGVTVRRVGTGLNAQRSTGVAMLNGRIEDTAGIGIDAAASIAATVSANTLSRTGNDAISGVGYLVGTAKGMKVLNNTISDSGVTMNGDTVLSLPILNYGAVRAGTGGTVTGNNIVNAGYAGIWAWPSSTIANNVISGACTTLDDCGAIYAHGANHNSVISGNLVLRSRGAPSGKDPSISVNQAQGIYLDESASGITVSGNTATGNDYGIMLHVAAKNTVTGNKLYGNRSGQLWLQETRKTDYAAGDVYGNVVTANQIVTTSGTAKGIWLDTQFADTAHFGTFDGNRYFYRLFATVVDERTAASSTSFTLAQWKSATTTTTAVSRNNDITGWGASQTLIAPSSINGSNVVPNGNLALNSKDWTTWNQTSPFGTLVRESCPPGWCARYVTGGSAGILSSPFFSTVVGTWYRLTLDVASGNDGQTVDLVVRRGGGGANGYESLSDRSLKFKSGRSWARYSVLFKATKTINAKDPLTGDLGARIDFQNIQPGQVLSVANLELVPVTPADAMNHTDLLLNTGSTALPLACPQAATQPALCSNYLQLADNQPVSWPYMLAPRSSAIVYTRDPRLVDTDGDGIPDVQDECPGTPANTGVNSRGCPLVLH